MSGRIAQALARAKAERRAALVTYFCAGDRGAGDSRAGDPDPASTADRIVAIAEAGADVIELGIPFSDPTADGPVIQRASERALRAGTTLPLVLDAVRAARARTEVPIVLFGYYNPIHARGEERVAREAADAGADGFLIVDLPPEEAAVLRDPALAHGLDWIPLVAPTSTEARVALAAATATSFVYVISVAGVTGAGQVDLAAAAKRAAAVGARTGKPVALGFGIKTPEDVRAASDHVDAVVVGSALVSAMHDGGLEAGVELVRRLRAV